MTEEKFVEKYGDIKVYFKQLHKNKFLYYNKDKTIIIQGSIDYSDLLSDSETIRSLSYYDNFKFEIKGTPIEILMNKCEDCLYDSVPHASQCNSCVGPLKDKLRNFEPKTEL